MSALSILGAPRSRRSRYSFREPNRGLVDIRYFRVFIFLFYKYFFLSFIGCHQGPEVRSGDLPQPIMLTSGEEFTFTIRRGVGTSDCVSVNYDDFVNDVEVGDMLLVDGMLYLFFLLNKDVSII